MHERRKHKATPEQRALRKQLERRKALEPESIKIERQKFIAQLGEKFGSKVGKLLLKSMISELGARGTNDILTNIGVERILAKRKQFGSDEEFVKKIKEEGFSFFTE